MVGGEARKTEQDREEGGDEEQAATKTNNPQRKRARDHGLEFGGFKTMLGWLRTSSGVIVTSRFFCRLT